MTMKLESSAFGDGGVIPSRYTCDGKNVSPPLAWRDIPTAARSLALVVEDPDAPDPRHPKTTWAHWLLYNLPPTEGALTEATHHGFANAKDGLNDWRQVGYCGPCPPIGQHRYLFRLCALDRELPDLDQPDRRELLAAMEGHILEEARLLGTYGAPGSRR